MAKDIKRDTDDPPNNSSNENTRKSVSLTAYIFTPSVVEDSNFGKASEGRLSFEIGAQLYIYKGLFIGFFSQFILFRDY